MTRRIDRHTAQELRRAQTSLDAAKLSAHRNGLHQLEVELDMVNAEVKKILREAVLTLTQGGSS